MTDEQKPKSMSRVVGAVGACLVFALGGAVLVSLAVWALVTIWGAILG